MVPSTVFAGNRAPAVHPGVVPDLADDVEDDAALAQDDLGAVAVAVEVERAGQKVGHPEDRPGGHRVRDADTNASFGERTPVPLREIVPSTMTEPFT